MKELLVRTPNPKALEQTIQHFGALVGDHPEPDGSCVVRVFPPNDQKLDFVKFAITNQGYAEVVGEREIQSTADCVSSDPIAYIDSRSPMEPRGLDHSEPSEHK